LLVNLDIIFRNTLSNSGSLLGQLLAIYTILIKHYTKKMLVNETHTNILLT